MMRQKYVAFVLFMISTPCLAEVYQNSKFGVVFSVPKGFVVSEQVVDVPKPEKGSSIPMGVPLSFNTIRVSDKASKNKEISQSITILVERPFMFDIARMLLKARHDLKFSPQAVSIGSWQTQKWPYYPGPFGFTAFAYTFLATDKKEVGIFGPRLKSKSQKFEDATKAIIKTLSVLD